MSVYIVAREYLVPRVEEKALAALREEVNGRNLISQLAHNNNETMGILKAL